ncbi:MAG: serine-type D-Ala-D-Ala carboxypeptidase [Gammaproteobacteria bacterium]|jgi:D-alanyl-D-alanine carboxypeptidase (penicillin-binding protein 5/6)|nr:serine-type D-Ala-D-Ala carboxypeptidase [Gammaproteobacteria bacterium]
MTLNQHRAAPARLFVRRIGLFLVPVLLLLSSLPAQALPDIPIPAPPQLNADSYILVDADSGTVLVDREAGKRVAPASLTKLMTAYVVFHALRDDLITLEEEVTVSRKAYRTPGSRMFIEINSRVSVQDLLMGMIVQSGNDASVALAEHIAGSEGVFAEMMNRYARELGMNDSHFQNATGLPGDNHLSTARDMATLASALINDFPEYYRWYSVREFTYNEITQRNRNRLLWRDPTVDGFKTGHTDAAGYCLVASAVRDDMRLISVVMGSPSARVRTDASQALLNYGFRFFETHRLFAAGDVVETTRVWKGATEAAPLGVSRDLFVTIPRGTYDRLQPLIEMPATVIAPVDEGQTLGELRIELDDQLLAAMPLAALAPVAEGTLWQRLSDEVMLWFE